MYPYVRLIILLAVMFAGGTSMLDVIVFWINIWKIYQARSLV